MVPSAQPTNATIVHMSVLGLLQSLSLLTELPCRATFMSAGSSASPRPGLPAVALRGGGGQGGAGEARLPEPGVPTLLPLCVLRGGRRASTM